MYNVKTKKVDFWWLVDFQFSWVPCSTEAELNVKNTVSPRYYISPLTLDLVLEPRFPDIPHVFPHSSCQVSWYGVPLGSQPPEILTTSVFALF